MPVLFQITNFLFKYMAESILMELASYWDENEVKKNNLNLTMVQRFRSSIKTLVIADDIRKYRPLHNSITELLQPYNVGTEKSKQTTPRPEFNSILGPLKDVDFSSIIKKGKRIQVKETNNVVSEELQNETPLPFEKRTYKYICESIIVMIWTLRQQRSCIQVLNDHIGFQLLQHRSGYDFFGNNETPVFDQSERKKQWKEALRLANVETRPFRKTHNKTNNNNVNNNENVPVRRRSLMNVKWKKMCGMRRKDNFNGK